ncbi:MAG: hypothetical protein JRF43_05870 [Deltaproteobacteria bacterium]|nr:hypothetical protein [Deltaproteobacteria bacterium]
MILSLPASSDVLWSGFKAKLKSQIRRPEKEGLRGHMGGPELLEDFYVYLFLFFVIDFE